MGQTICKLINATPFSMQIANPNAAGSDWQDLLPAGTVISPGTSPTIIGKINEPNRFQANRWGWIYVDLLTDPVQHLQVFAEALSDLISGQSAYGGMGPYRNETHTADNPLPYGGVSALVTDNGDGHDLTYVFRGTDVQLNNTPLALPCAMATYVDDAGNNTLFLMGGTPRGHDAPTMAYSVVSLGTGNTILNTVTDPSQWHTIPFQPPSWKGSGDRNSPSTLSPCSLATLDVDLYCIWSQCDYQNGVVGWRLLASNYNLTSNTQAPDALGGAWNAPIALLDPDGTPIGSYSGGKQVFNIGQYGPDPGDTWYSPTISAIACGDESLLVAMLVPDNNHIPYLALRLFNVADILPSDDGTLQWKAKTVLWWSSTDIFNKEPQWQNKLTHLDLASIHIEWYSTPQTTAPNAPLALWLVISAFDKTAQKLGIGIHQLHGLDQSPQVLSVDPAIAGVTYDAQGPATLKRDVGGRVLAYLPTAGGTSTIVIPSASAPTSINWSNIQPTTTPGQWPGAAFCYAIGAVSTTISLNVQIAGQSASPSFYPVYQCLAYVGWPLVRCQVQLIGWAMATSMVPIGLPPLSPGQPRKKLIKGIIDAPMPVPNVNVNAIAQNAINYEPVLGVISYGTTIDGTNTHEVSINWGAGFKASAQTTVGVGPAYDLSLFGSIGHISKNSSSTMQESEESLTTSILVDRTQQPPTATVDPYGVLFGAEARLGLAVYKYFIPDANGQPTAALDAGSAWQLSVSYLPSTTAPIIPYAVTPGDLFSYTKEQWNQRMGADYFENTIVPNAYTFPDGTNCLTISWSVGGFSDPPSYAEFKEQFVEWSWSLDASVYAGLSGGVEANVPVEGEEVEAYSWSAMAGVTFSVESSTSTETQTGWRITFKDLTGLLAQGIGLPGNYIPNSVSAYTFNLYFLPNNNKWTQELIARLPQQPTSGVGIGSSEIDPGSNPWRIVFVVTQIVDATGDVSKNYPPGSASSGTKRQSTAVAAPAPVPVAAPAPELVGARIKDGHSNAIYLVVTNGSKRLIPDMETYNRLFRDTSGIQNVPNVNAIISGPAITPMSYLGKSSHAPNVYLVSNEMKYWITSPAVMDKFNFAWNEIKQVPQSTLDALLDGPYLDLPDTVAPPTPAVASQDLHIVGISTDGVLWHTLRRYSSDGNWQGAFGNVNNQHSNGSSLRFTRSDCAGIGGGLHICAIDQSGVIWHTIRNPNGSWQPAFGNVNDQHSNGSSLRFTKVSCTGTASGKLHVCATDQSGVIWHTIRNPNGSWQPAFGDVNDQHSNGSSLRFSTVGQAPVGGINCAAIGEDLHLVAIATSSPTSNTAGETWHTVRFADGSWQPAFNNITPTSGSGPITASTPFLSVSCAESDDALQVCGLPNGGVGNIFHRSFANGTWEPTYDFSQQYSNNGKNIPATSIDCAGVGNDLHVCFTEYIAGTDTSGIIWHLVHSSGGSWSSLDNVSQDNHAGTSFSNVSITNVG